MATSIGTKPVNPSIGLPALDLKSFVRRKVRDYWQRLWDTRTSNKLHLIKPQIGKWPPHSKVRRTEVTLCRLRIGHTYGTHAYLLLGNDPPVCGECGETLTVLHALLECRKLDVLRKKHFPLAFRQRIPLHPALFLGTDPLFSTGSVLSFLRECQVLQVFAQFVP